MAPKKMFAWSEIHTILAAYRSGDLIQCAFAASYRQLSCSAEPASSVLLLDNSISEDVASRLLRSSPLYDREHVAVSLAMARLR